jgi:hypothetical protein
MCESLNESQEEKDPMAAMIRGAKAVGTCLISADSMPLYPLPPLAIFPDLVHL